jgi:hypothetical protein
LARPVANWSAKLPATTKERNPARRLDSQANHAVLLTVHGHQGAISIALLCGTGGFVDFVIDDGMQISHATLRGHAREPPDPSDDFAIESQRTPGTVT